MAVNVNYVYTRLGAGPVSVFLYSALHTKLPKKELNSEKHNRVNILKEFTHEIGKLPIDVEQTRVKEKRAGI